MRTLTLDLGTHTGWALLREGAPLASGTLHLASEDELELQRREGRERTLDIRFARIHALIVEHIRQGVTRIVFEDVGFASPRMQAQLWASLRSAIWAAALANPEVRVFALPVATLKQFAAGHARAQKPEMAQALARLLPGSYRLADDLIRKADGACADHNEVDAIWLALYTQDVDRGERSFLGVYQRKRLHTEERRQRRKQRKQKTRARRAAAAAAAKCKRTALKVAIKSLGRCCGVLRRQRGRWAICPACGSTAAIPKLTIQPVSAVDPEDSEGSTPNSICSTAAVPEPGPAQCPANTKN